ncbi:hypothetical protein Gotri_026028 [Gossypium trilobum]|uniref:NB-ARC domain-containing protein n=1 Tax=Gossypium trilobum TaxID=34281 RepID=A0A7J9FNV7_9ROSI|nr:hypothetical protein [Gossypium trilobum]
MDSIAGHVNYICKLKQTLPTLSAALQELTAQRNDRQSQVDLAERQLKPFEQVQLWLSKAETMITEAEKLIADGPQQINNLCLGGCGSKNYLSSYKFGKKVAEMLQEISDHKSTGVFEKVAENQPAASVVVRPVEQRLALESTIQKFSTTPNVFEVVIWALVSKDSDVGKIQDRIGGNFGFSDDSWKNKSVDQKAPDIYGALRNKRFIVLLDDLWERLDLNQVGIPKPSQENGSKLNFVQKVATTAATCKKPCKTHVACMEPETQQKHAKVHGAIRQQHVLFC